MLLSDFGITRLSPSSLNSWAASPSLWVLHYLFGFKDYVGPAAARGSAVESGLRTYLYNLETDLELILLQAESEFDTNLQGEVGNHVDKERAILRPMIQTAIRGATERGISNLIGTQLRCSAFLPGVDVEVSGYLDFCWGNGMITELKTTKRMPSEPRESHLRQAAFYRYSRDMAPLELMYVSDKRVLFYDVPDDVVQVEIQRMTEDAKSLVKCLNAFSSPVDMLSALPQSGLYKWSDEAISYRKLMIEDSLT